VDIHDGVLLLTGAHIPLLGCEYSITGADVVVVDVLDPASLGAAAMHLSNTQPDLQHFSQSV
jgi:hypothetical protein